MPSVEKVSRPKYHLGRYARWTGLPGTPKKLLANAGGRHWKDVFGRMRSSDPTASLPYQERTGHHLAKDL